MPSVEIEVARGLRNRLLVCLLQRFLEPARERIASRLLCVDGLLEDGFARGRFIGEDALGVADLRFVTSFGLAVRHDPPKVEVDHQCRPTTRAHDFEFGFVACHQRFPPRSLTSVDTRQSESSVRSRLPSVVCSWTVRWSLAVSRTDERGTAH